MVCEGSHVACIKSSGQDQISRTVSLPSWRPSSRTECLTLVEPFAVQYRYVEAAPAGSSGEPDPLVFFSFFFYVGSEKKSSHKALDLNLGIRTLI